MRVVLRNCGFVLFLAAAGGCKNSPSALRMELAAQSQTVQREDAIHLAARLVAADGPICLGQSLQVDAELISVETGERWKSPPVAYCGTGLAITFPLFPVFYAVGWLDVMDVMDRYDVLEKGDVREHRIVLRTSADSWLFVATDGLQLQSAPSYSEIPSERYRLRVTLANTIDPRYVMDFFPPPIFWKKFDQPIAGEVELIVED